MRHAGFLRGALCAVVFVASLASAQQYADAATLQALRNNIELVRQQVNQLRGMGADAATMNLMQENLRYLELHYSSLAGTGPAPGSPQMIAAERAWLETQYRNLQTQRQQLAQMGADRASLAMLDQSLAEMRRSIDTLNATALNGPAYNAPAYSSNQNALPGQPNLAPGDAWVATYNPVGPNGLDCTPFYDGRLNRWLVPGGCPMPGPGAPLPPLPGATTLPKYDLKPLPQPAGTTRTAPMTPAPIPGARTSSPTPNYSPTFSVPVAPPLTAPMTPAPNTAVIQSAPAGAANLAPPQCGFEVRPPCRSKDGSIKGDASAYYAPAPATAPTASGGSTTVNWGHKDKRQPSIKTTRSTTSKFEQTTTISRYDLTIDGCKVKEARIDYKHNGFLGDAQVSGKVTLTPAGCTPDPNTRLFMRLEQGGVVGWIEMKPNWSSSGASGFSSLTGTEKSVHKLEGFAVVGTWDKATAIKCFTDGVVKGFLVVPAR